jgi:hypothetical protein
VDEPLPAVAQPPSASAPATTIQPAKSFGIRVAVA